MSPGSASPRVSWRRNLGAGATVRAFLKAVALPPATWRQSTPYTIQSQVYINIFDHEFCISFYLRNPILTLSCVVNLARVFGSCTGPRAPDDRSGTDWASFGRLPLEDGGGGAPAADHSTSDTLRAMSSSSSASLAGDANVTTAQELALEWFEANVALGHVQLAVGVNTALGNLTTAERVCGGFQPSLQARSASGPNGGCPDYFAELNASCACLDGFTQTDDAWEFRVAKPSSSNASEGLQTVVDGAAALQVDSIRTLLVPPSVTTLKLVGVGSDLPKFDFVPQDIDIPGTTLPLAVNSEDTSADTSITTVYIENIDLSSIVLSAYNFFPSTVLNLTMRNCNLTKYGYGFMQGIAITYLDVSSNRMEGAYAGFVHATSCSDQLCAIQSLNLTNNLLSTFPTSVFGVDDLQELYLRGNPITDFNMSESIFNSVRGLRVFEADPVEGAACPDGTWQEAHNFTFCVTNATATATALTESSSTSKYLIYGVIVGAAVILILVGIVIQQRVFGKRRKRRGINGEESCSSNDEYDTLNFDDTYVQVDAALLDDPVLVTNRIDYKELKFGSCLSKGGFGLVFAGKFRGRHVAIKKIRPDHSSEVREIEQFLREIILMAQLYHPRIVEFIGVSWDVLRHLSAVTEFMDAGDLRNVLHGYKLQGKPLTWLDHKTNITLHIAEALSYLHSLQPKVIHRDLKSKNVLLNLHLEAKLSDFGISRQRYRVVTHDMTAGIGTSFWIAPEVLLGRDYDERADIYSFGVVLSEIDTDDYPYWNDANPQVTRGKIREAEILSLVAAGDIRPAFSESCPRAILQLADACLSKNPKDRPNAAEIVLALQHLESSLRGSAVSPPVSPSSSGDPWSVRSSSA